MFPHPTYRFEETCPYSGQAMNFPCFTLEGSAWSRGAGAGLAGKREFSKGCPSAFKRSHPPDTLHRHIETTPPGSAGVSPASSPFACRSVSLRCGSRPSCRREPHGPGRCRAMAPLPVDPGGGDGRGCTRICAGGTPALPGGFIQGHRATKVTISQKHSGAACR